MSMVSADTRVALSRIGDAEVSTVFLGIDYGFGRTPDPLLFETMVFYGPDRECGRMMRYFTWEEAERGHADIVQAAEEELRRSKRDANELFASLMERISGPMVPPAPEAG